MLSVAWVARKQQALQDIAPTNHSDMSKHQLQAEEALGAQEHTCFLIRASSSPLKGK